MNHTDLDALLDEIERGVRNVRDALASGDPDGATASFNELKEAVGRIDAMDDWPDDTALSEEDKERAALFEKYGDERLR
jgi:hypothetical protein